jgi:hypothetical protein
MSIKIIKSESELPPGAVRVHLYDWKDVLHPRGSWKKESFGPDLLEKLTSTFDQWTDPKYGDNPPVKDLVDRILFNFSTEMSIVRLQFIAYANEKIKEQKLK